MGAESDNLRLERQAIVREIAVVVHCHFGQQRRTDFVAARGNDVGGFDPLVKTAAHHIASLGAVRRSQRAGEAVPHARPLTAVLKPYIRVAPIEASAIPGPEVLHVDIESDQVRVARSGALEGNVVFEIAAHDGVHVSRNKLLLRAAAWTDLSGCRLVSDHRVHGLGVKYIR